MRFADGSHLQTHRHLHCLDVHPDRGVPDVKPQLCNDFFYDHRLLEKRECRIRRAAAGILVRNDINLLQSVFFLQSPFRPPTRG